MSKSARVLLLVALTGASVAPLDAQERGNQPSATTPPATSGRARNGRLFVTTLNVVDLSAALRFFVDGLGMREQGRHIPAKGVIEVSLGYADEPLRSGLMLLHRESQATPYQRGEWGKVILEVPDLQATTARVARAGGTIVRAVREVASAPVLNAIVEDPDGHVFELIQFK